jgi:bile acid:Na+ symporter, BASS family
MFTPLIIIGFTLLSFVLSLLFITTPEYAITLKFLIVPLLGTIMFMMGTTLSVNDFTRLAKKPQAIIIALLLQFLLMPLFAWLISLGLALDEALLIGMVVVGASPGGTASNVMTFLAKGDSALSVTITAFSTLLSFVLTPLLISVYVGQSVSFDFVAMLLSIVKMVILPIIGGMVLHVYFTKLTLAISKVSTHFSLIAIALIIALVLGLNSERLEEMLYLTLFAVMLHNLLGLMSAFLIVRNLALPWSQKKAIVIEVGMQNSALAMIIATKFFSVSSAIPAALFSLWHNVSGILLAYWWNRKV